MNEEALRDAYGLFVETGYKGTIEDFSRLIETNNEALSDAHKLFVETGYNGSIDDFASLVKKKEATTQSGSASGGSDSSLRPDGTKKGGGFLGELKMRDGSGKIATELSIGVEFDGQETEIPLLVPTLNEEEKEFLLSGADPRLESWKDPIAKSIIDKAVAHAKERKNQGKPVFKEEFKYKDEQEAGSRYAQAGDPLLPIVVSNSQKRLDELKSQLNSEKKNVDYQRGYGTDKGFHVPKNPQKVKQLETEIAQLEQAVTAQKKKMEEIDLAYNADILGVDMRQIKSTMEAEKELEGSAGDFLSRVGSKFVKMALSIPQSVPIGQSEAKQRAKYALEASVQQQIKEAYDKALAKSSEYEKAYSTVKEEYDNSMASLSESYTSGQISYEEYKQLFEEINTETAKTQASLQSQAEKYVSTLQDFEKSLGSLSIAAAYDNQSWLEANAKEFGNEWIKTPRQVAGLMKSVSSLMDFAASLPDPVQKVVGALLPMTQLAAEVDPEKYLNAVSPLTDYMQDLTEKGLFRVDEERDVMVGQVAGQLSKIIPASTAAPMAGYVVMAGMSFDEMYQQAKVDGVSEQEAINMATIYTPIGMALEYYGAKTGIEALAKRELRRTAMRVIAQGGLTSLPRQAARINMANGLLSELGENVVKEFLEEGITEALQSVAQEGIMQLKNLQRGENLYEFNLTDFATEVKNSFIYGGLAGGGAAMVFTTLGVGGKSPSVFQAYRDILTNETAVQNLRDNIARDVIMTEEERQAALNNLNRDYETINSIVGLNLSPAQEKTAADLITRKKVIEQAIEGKDKALTQELRDEIKAIDERLAAMKPRVETQSEEQAEVSAQAQEDIKNEEDGKEEPVLEGVRESGNQEEGGQDSTQLRTEEEVGFGGMEYDQIPADADLDQLLRDGEITPSTYEVATGMRDPNFFIDVILWGGSEHLSPKEAIQFLDQVDASKLDLSRLYEAYEQELSNPTHMTAVEQAIANNMMSDISMDSWNRFADRNIMEPTLAKTYGIKKGGRIGLDIIAQSAAIELYGFDGVTDQIDTNDVVNFMLRFPNGYENTPRNNPNLKTLSEAHKRATGVSLDNRNLKSRKAKQQEINKKKEAEERAAQLEQIRLTEEEMKIVREEEVTLAKEFDQWFESLTDEQKEQYFTDGTTKDTSTESRVDDEVQETSKDTKGRTKGELEKEAEKQLAKAREELDGAKERREAKRKELRSQQGKESQQQIFDEPKSVLFDEQADLSEKTFQAALKPFDDAVVSAEKKVAKAEEQVSKAREADTQQTSISDVSKTESKVEKADTNPKLESVEATAKALEGVEKNKKEKLLGDKVIYHGTGSDFSILDESSQNKATGHGDFGKGFYFSLNEGIARYYSLKFDKAVRKVKSYIYNIAKPFEINIDNEVFDNATKEKLKKLKGLQSYERDIILNSLDKEFGYKLITKGIGDSRFSDILQTNGFDAVWVNRTLGGETTSGAEIVVFDKNKVSEITDKSISEAYHKAKADGSNPELVKAVEELLGESETSQKAPKSGTNSKKSLPQKQTPAKTTTTKEQKKQAAFETIDKLRDALKDRLKIDLPDGTQKMGVSQEAIIDLIAETAKALAATGVEISEAIRKVVKELQDLGAIAKEDAMNYAMSARVKVELENLPSREQTTKTLDGSAKTVAQEAEENVFGIMNAMADESVLEETDRDSLRKSIKDFERIAKDMVESGLINPARLVDEIISKPRALQPEESAALIYYATKLANEIDILSDRIEQNRKDGDKEALSLNQLLLAQKTADNMALDEAGLLSGVIQGQALWIRRMVMNNRYKASVQAAEYKAKTGNETIPAEVMEKFKEYERKIRELDKRLEEQEKKIVENSKKLHNPKKTEKKELSPEKAQRLKELRGKFLGAMNDVSRIATLLADKEFYEYAKLVLEQLNYDAKAWAAEMVTAIGKGVKKHLPEIYKKIGGKDSVDFGQALPKIVEGELEIPNSYIISLIEEGFDTVEAIVPELQKRLKELDLDVTERQVRDAVSQYGVTSTLSQKEVDRALRKIRRVGKLLSALEDAMAKKRPLRSGKERDALDEQERSLKRKIDRLLRDIPDTDEEVQKKWKTALEAAKKRMSNEIERIEKQLATGEKTPKRNPIQYDQEANELRERLDYLKKVLKAAEGPRKLTPEQRVKIITEALQRRKAEYQDRLRRKDFAPDPQPERISTPAIDKLRDEVKALREEFKEKQNAAFPNKEQERKNNARLKQLEKLIRAAETKLEEKIFTETKKKSRPEYNAKVKAAEAELQRLRDDIKQLDEYKEFAEKQRLTNKKKSMERAIKRYQEMIDKKEFTKEKPAAVKLDEEAKRLRIEQIRWKNKMETEKHKAILAARSKWAEWGDYIIDAIGLPRALMASVDLSAPLRQGFLLSVRNPRAAAKAFNQMFQQAFSEFKYEKWLDDLEGSDEFQYAKSVGLYIAKPNSVLLAKEEQFVSSLASKIPVYGTYLVRGSERAYSSYLNVLRMEVFKGFYNNMLDTGLDPVQDVDVFKYMARFINNATGRGNILDMGMGEKFLNATFFAPRYVMSRFNVLFNTPLYALGEIPGFDKISPYPKQVRREALKTMLAFAATQATLLYLLALSGADVEDDPRSADFLKARFGDLRFDTLAGFQQVMVLVSRLFTASRKNAKGEVRKLNVGGYKDDTILNESMGFLRKKLSPPASMVVDFLDAPRGKTKDTDILFGSVTLYDDMVLFKTVMGEDLTMTDKLLSMVTPLYLQDMQEIYEQDGLPTVFAAMFPAMFGAGVQNYSATNNGKKVKQAKKGLDGLEFPEITLEEMDFDFNDIEL